MKRWIALAALTTFVASGCAGTVALSNNPAVPTKPGQTTRPGEVVTGGGGDAQTGKVLDMIGLPVEALAGVAFKTISQANAKNLGNGLGGGSSAAPGATMAKGAAAPPMADTGASGGNLVAEGGSRNSDGDEGGSSAGGAYSGNSDSYYGYGYWFGGAEQMSLVSMTLGETEGSPTFVELAKKVGPVVKAWDPSARLLETSGNLGTDGKLFQPTPQPSEDTDVKIGGVLLPACGVTSPEQQFWDGSAWRLVYRSASRNEILQIAGKADKTLIVRMRWAPLDLDLEEVQVDAGAAITKVASAIRDKAAMAEEEQTKLDYFLGIPFEQRTGLEWQDRRRTKLEVLYTVPANAQWNASLDRVLGKLVWQLSFYGYDEKLQRTAQEEAKTAFKAQGFAAFGLTDPNDPNAPTPPLPSGCNPYGRYYPYWLTPEGKPTPLPVPSPGQELIQPDPNVWVNMNCQAIVDARTGTLIRFSRPTKTINIPEKYLRDLRDAQGRLIPTPSSEPMPIDDVASSKE